MPRADGSGSGELAQHGGPGFVALQRFDRTFASQAFSVGRFSVSNTPDKLLLEALRFALSNLEADPHADSVKRAELMGILRERIAELEGASRLREEQE